jgi:O-antigen ligase
LGVLVTILAIFATGSRGAWLASAALVGFASLVAIVRTVTRARRDPAPRSLAPLAITAALILAAAGALLVTQRDALARRFDLARQDLAAAREGHYGTDTGARLLMWIWAARAVDAHPLQGVGAGGYQAWTKSRIRALEGEPAAAAAPIHAHAHSAALHLAATTGLVGLSLAGAAAALAVLGPAVGRVRRTPAPSPPPIDPPPPASGAYAHAAPLGVLGLLLAGTFDVVQLNTQTAAVLFTLLPFCMVALPAPRPAPLRLMPRLRVL